MKMKTGVILAGFAVAAAAGFFFARGEKPYNSVLDEPRAPIVKTAYMPGAAAQPIDFEKAASAAVPSVVHIRTTTKFKEVSGKGSPGERDPFGDMFGGDLFKRFFGEGNGRSYSMPDQRAS